MREINAQESTIISGGQCANRGNCANWQNRPNRPADCPNWQNRPANGWGGGNGIGGGFGGGHGRRRW